MQYFSRKMKSPIGVVTLIANESSLVAILWAGEAPDARRFPGVKPNAQLPVLQEAERQLGEYFQGKRTGFDLPLNFQGTPFQNKVWKALRKIPHGKTASYGEIAKKVGSPKASRAVGAANGQNPIPIVVPCHRVIGADGSLTGFGGGLGIKKQLLALEASGFSGH